MTNAVVALPAVAAPPAVPTEATLDAEALGRLLGALASRPGPLPKYHYPSAGTLYPIQTYLVLRQSFGALSAGSYYHDPQEHALAPLSSELPAAPDGSTPAVLLTLVAQRAAIEPVYADEAETFCMLECGYMSEALRQAAAGLMLRYAGDPAEDDPGRFAEAFRLEPSHLPLVCWAVEAAGR